MDVKSNAKIELTKSTEDWKLIRECFVNSFRHYPLYKYMVPDPSKRDAFLRAYLDANYDVTVGSGEGILLGVKVHEDGADKIIGGVLFVPPSSDGCGWAIGNDEPYWEAYEKHGLAKISPDGLERVKRYEAWENKHICTKLGTTKIPMWNGLFCSIEPRYASKGVGSAVYKEAIRVMSQDWKQRKAAARKNKVVRINSLNVLDKRSDKTGASSVHEFIRSLSLKNLHCNALLHHRVTPRLHAASCQETAAVCEDSSAPLVVAISHSDRAARFHASNGFSPVLRIPYCDADGQVVFYSHVLAMDPFSTGKIATCKDELNILSEAPKKQSLSEMPITNHIQYIETC